MKTSLALLLLTAGAAYPQFENLSTTGDGQTVYFSTRSRLRGSNHQPYAKVYRLDSSGFQLLGQAPYGSHSVETGGWLVESASLTGDGRVVAINSSASCHWGTPCAAITQEFAAIYFGGSVARYKGHAQIGRQGRFALLLRTTGFAYLVGDESLDPPGQGLSFLNLTTGVITSLHATAPARSGHWIAADGTALAQPFLSQPSVMSQRWVLASPSGVSQDFGPAPGASQAIIADDASFVIYKPNTSELRIRDRGGSDYMLAPDAFSPSIAADSRRILYLAPAGEKYQAVLLEQRGAAPVQVTSEPDGISEAVLSGNGAFVVATTGSGRLIRIDLGAKQRAELIGPSPKLEPLPVDEYGGDPLPCRERQVPGSTYSILGDHLAPDEIGRVQVFAAGVPAAVHSVSPGEIRYQVAWETPSHEPTAILDEVILHSGDNRWEAVVPIYAVSPLWPQAIQLARETVPDAFGRKFPIYGIHGDWRGLVSNSDPAHPGEYVHLYATGFGPVQPSVPTGAPGPADPPARIVLDCSWTALGNPLKPLEAPFAGLAPGLIGIYQITFRVPEDWAFSSLQVGCNGFPMGSDLPVRP